MTLLLGLFLFSSSETELWEADIILPKGYSRFEVFYDLLNNPLDINTADYDDFCLVPFLNPIIIKSILDYRQKHKGFKKLTELLQVSGITKELFNKIRPFLSIKFKRAKPKMEMRIRVKNDSVRATDCKDWALTNRIKIRGDDFSLVFLTDKDASESNLCDFWAASLAYFRKNSQLIIGNYTLSFGQGLIFAQPSYELATAKSLGGFKPKAMSQLTSPLENNHQWGLAYGQSFSHLYLISFLSNTRLDAAIDTQGFVKKVFYSGEHSDSISIANKDRLREGMFGSRLEYRSERFRFGLAGYYNYYNHHFAPSDSVNSFFGNRIIVLGVEGSGILNNYYWQTELAYCLGQGLGIGLSILGNWQNLKTGLNLFGSQKNFYSPHSRSYSLSNKKDNLSGNFSLNYDFARFKIYFSARTKTDFVTDSLPAKIEAGIKRKEGKFNIDLSHKITFKDAVSKSQGTRLDWDYDFSKNFSLGFRLEDYHLFVKPGRGILFRFSADLNYRWLIYAVRLYCFEVNSTEVRLFAYEPGGSGLGNNQSFSDKGIRCYSFIGYNQNRLKAGLSSGITKKTKTTLDLGTQIEIRR